MSTFLEIEPCKTCQRRIPWEWIPSVLVRGRPLAGTGVWRSSLSDGICASCHNLEQAIESREKQLRQVRQELVGLLGGERHYREFTFERYNTTAKNRLALERTKNFDPSTDNLYLWGPCGVGKTHLALATAGRAYRETLSVRVLPAFQLSRKLRMKDPAEEQAIINEWVSTEVLVLDDLGVGSNTAFVRQILQELLDGRTVAERGGLLITSKYSLDELAMKLTDDAIPSRISGLCNVIEIKGDDYRTLLSRSTKGVPPPLLPSL